MICILIQFGHNATLLLNVPPNNQGTVDKAILDRVTEFGNNIKATFKTNLAKAEGASVKVLKSEVVQKNINQAI